MTLIPADHFDVTLQHKSKQSVDRYFDKIFYKLPKNTQRAYLSDIKLYRAFCHDTGNIGFSDSIELVEKSLEEFTTYMCKLGRARATITRRMAAISAFLDIAQLPNPVKTSKHLKDFIRTEMPEYGILEEQKQAEPLTVELLNHINDTIIPKNLLDLRDLAIVNTAFDGLLRANEIQQLRVQDISRRSGTIKIRKSKTDQTGKGQNRYISQKTLSIIDDYLDTVNVDKKTGFMRAKDDPSAIYNGLLFRALTVKGTSLRLPKIKGKTISPVLPIDYKTVLMVYKRVAEKAKLTVDLTAHSARVGAAVSMAEADISSLKIQRAGGWKSAAMPARYTEQASHAIGGMAEINNLKR
jgi:integrase